MPFRYECVDEPGDESPRTPGFDLISFRLDSTDDRATYTAVWTLGQLRRDHVVVLAAYIDDITLLGAKSYDDLRTPPDGYVFSFANATNAPTARPVIDVGDDATTVTLTIDGAALIDITADSTVTDVLLEVDGLPFDVCDP